MIGIPLQDGGLIADDGEKELVAVISELASRKIWPRENPFFFSSRRGHTRWNCDWSSDVCSSDLGGSRLPKWAALLRIGFRSHLPVKPLWNRSEERRVGKESTARSSRWRSETA